MKRLRLSLKYYGLTGALLHTSQRVLKLLGISQRLQHRLWQNLEQRFDRRFNVVTIEWFDLDVFLFYEPTSAVSLHHRLDQLGIDFSKYTFVDFGSGKGRALLVASEFPFKKIRGVEMSADAHSESLVNFSRYNSRTQKCKDIDAVCLDARLYDLPDTPVVVYMFNPFPADVLADVLDRALASYAVNPRPILFVYQNPLQRQVLDGHPKLRSLETGDSWWAVYEVKGEESEVLATAQ